MAEICKISNKILKLKQGITGSAFIIAILVLGLMVFLAAYFISFSLAGSSMANSQKFATQTYYLAEAGIQEAIFKLKNDPIWKSAFETLPTAWDPSCSSWSIPLYQRIGGIFSNGGYELTVNNLGCAQAEIIAKAFLEINSNKKAQRIVKAKVFKAIGNSDLTFGIFTGGASGNVDLTMVNPLRVYGGDLFIKNNLNINFSSDVSVDGKILVGNNYLSSLSQVSSLGVCAFNVCESGCDDSTECPPPVIEIPPLDFDSASPSSYLSAAQNSNCGSLRSDGKTNCVFTPAEFEKVLWNYYPDISFPLGATIYVKGDINIRAGQSVIVNGVLASDRDINLGESNCWTRPEPPNLRCGFSSVQVIRPGQPDDNFPSGLLAKRKLNGGQFLGFGSAGMEVTGLVYSGDEMKFQSVPGPITIYGGLVARKISFSSTIAGFDVYFDPDVITDTFGTASYSPVIIVDHWEEEY
ncbi:MAG: hypothetical protein PHE77_02630 [Candidatus Pacebacteria bacterium]|nr:hypothetical protein [Candidatus Paceibacterota bacterium]